MGIQDSSTLKLSTKMSTMTIINPQLQTQSPISHNKIKNPLKPISGSLKSHGVFFLRDIGKFLILRFHHYPTTHKEGKDHVKTMKTSKEHQKADEQKEECTTMIFFSFTSLQTSATQRKEKSVQNWKIQFRCVWIAQKECFFWSAILMVHISCVR